MPSLSSTPAPGQVLSPWGQAGLELERPERLVEPAPWVGHIPAAFYLVEALGPRMAVELGVHTGNSFCSFAQAISRMGLETRLFGVDHWRGDEHAGAYGEEVYQELKAYHDPRYGTFSRLLRMSFDEALSSMPDASIDLLHIDGFHTYEAVKHDFETWLPKVSSRAVVLFHDTNVREYGFGVWRFWGELRSAYPGFEFLHSHGLGVAYVGSEPPPDRLQRLLQAANDELDCGKARRYFALLGSRLNNQLAIEAAEQTRAAFESRAVAAETAIKAMEGRAIAAENAARAMEDRAIAAEAANLPLEGRAVASETAATAPAGEVESLRRNEQELRARTVARDEVDALNRE